MHEQTLHIIQQHVPGPSPAGTSVKTNLCVHKLCLFAVVSVSKQVLVLEQYMFARNKIIFRKRPCTHVLDMVQTFKAFLLSSADLSLKIKLTSIIILEDQLWFNLFETT